MNQRKFNFYLQSIENFWSVNDKDEKCLLMIICHSNVYKKSAALYKN